MSKANYDQAIGPRSSQQDTVLFLPERGLFAVADGMGGLESGDIASQVAIEALHHNAPAVENLWEFQKKAHKTLDACHQAVLARLEGEGGTTLSFLQFLPGWRRAIVGHVGDSRIYRLRHGRLEQLTEDHNLPLHKNVLTAALGIEKHLVKAQVQLRTWQPGDTFLLCSDGFYEAMGDALLTYATQGRNARSLLRLAVSRELSDNASVIRIDL